MLCGLFWVLYLSANIAYIDKDSGKDLGMVLERKSSVVQLEGDSVPTPGQVVLACEAAYELMREHGVVPVPKTYALWFVYALGYLETLNKDIDGMINDNIPFTDAVCERLYGAHVESSVFCCGIANTVEKPNPNHKVLPTTPIGLLRAVEVVSGAQELEDSAAVKPPTAEVDDTDELALVATRAAVEGQRIASKSVAEAPLSQEMLHIQQHLDALRRDGRRCPVTGLVTQPIFKIVLKETIVLAEHYQHKLSIILLDVDNFRQFRGSFGERAGDQILRLIGRAISENVKSQDTVSRYDKKTFALLLTDVAEAEAIDIANAICSVLAGRSIVNRRTQDNLGQASLSLGVAEWQRGQTAQDVLRRASEALFSAKATPMHPVVSEP